MKKEIAVFGFLFLFAISLLPAVSAQQTGLSIVVIGIADSIQEIFDAIRFDVDNSSKVLLGILLWIVLFSVLSQMELLKVGNSGRILSGVVSLIITLLTFILMPPNFIEAIVLQYGALGATILTVIPFVIMIYFTFKVSKSLLVSRIAWIFYVVYYMSLFVYKIAETTTVNSGWDLVSQNIPYIGAIVAGALVFLFIKRLRIWKIEQEIDEMKERGAEAVEEIKLLNKLKRKELKGYTEGL